jgi:copper chaperone CopZ
MAEPFYQIEHLNKEKGERMKSHELTIQGMTCGHCVMHVKQALDAVDGMEVENVEIGKARVWFDDEKIAMTIAERVGEAGYKLVSVK